MTLRNSRRRPAAVSLKGLDESPQMAVSNPQRVIAIQCAAQRPCRAQASNGAGSVNVIEFTSGGSACKAAAVCGFASASEKKMRNVKSG